MATHIAQHPPAMRVGGRRLSLPSRPRPVVTSVILAPRDGGHSAPGTPGEPPDYPRPAPPGAEHELDHEHTHTEEEIPKKEKKQGNGSHENERRMRESAHRKAEENRPRKEGWAPGGKTIGGGGRIAQPAGKGFGA
ncbi:hypothetical protein HETIRDRAFT_114088 [Heterobasidion irregulare TC 32-1]|uniref:Uncharacterized protein n=1 Tax=Heterobasidion irregulare (strain TC 32-1) TaxID=747525 RepID=W4KLC5_HETIT|nr:uncharacterized protein HETIRDRAFT_114088 [Heterobasidion irregulare TC 32-1]ETW86627.1 hypothetical protein HETIRDRAFT_114088 [Heterobasidion irregulare TC 32-1]